jgi:hypothetical protein
MIRAIKDTRQGRQDLWVLVPHEVKRLMLVPDEMRKSVVFLYYRQGGNERPAGTAFFLGYTPTGRPRPESAVFLVTAHHVIAGIRGASDDGQVLIRMNTKDGGATWAEVSSDLWLHPQANVDCAVLSWIPPTELGVDYVGVGMEGTGAAEKIAQEGIGIGDEVFMVGLFRNHLGRDRNEPIIRVGNIAAVPTDPIRSGIYGDMRAILVEARSIGGLSGSPVWVHQGFIRLREGALVQWMPDPEAVGPFIFLGLMHGHWDALEAEVDSDAFGDLRRVNMGIGIVVPIAEIAQALETKFGEAIKTMYRERENANEPTPDVDVGESEYERFEELTEKLVQVPKEEVDKKRKEQSS